MSLLRIGAEGTRSSLRALAMLGGGGMLALTALTWLSARIGATVELAATTRGDFTALYLLGDGTAVVGALTIAIVTPLLLIAGVAIATVGYLRIARPGPSPITIRYPADPQAQPKQIALGFQGKY